MGQLPIWWGTSVTFQERPEHMATHTFLSPSAAPLPPLCRPSAKAAWAAPERGQVMLPMHFRPSCVLEVNEPSDTSAEHRA